MRIWVLCLALYFASSISVSLAQEAASPDGLWRSVAAAEIVALLNAADESSINFEALERAEALVTKLWSPPWPAEFGLDTTKAAVGEGIYHANCITCHAIMDRTDPRRDPKDVLVPIHQPFGPLKKPEDRKPSFLIGMSEFDPKTLGFKDEGAFEFDTSLPGNSNAGHNYGTSLSNDDKAELIEFLKTL